MPVGNAPVPAVVLVHGSGPHDADETVGALKPFRDLAHGLASRGVAVLRYDKRTKLMSEQPAPSVAGLTVREETIDDARAAVALLARTPGIDPSRIWIAGHSLGGYLAPRIAAARGPQVAGVAILAGNARPLEELVVEQVRFLAALDGRVTPPESAQVVAAERLRDRVRDPKLAADAEIDVLGSMLPGSYWLDLRAYDPVRAAAALTIPVVVLQGGRDYQVSRADFERWQKALAGRRSATLRWYPELDHLFATGSGPPGPADYQRPGPSLRA
jgi:alpha-beta hydrolase superfamily lysophospholipase